MPRTLVVGLLVATSGCHNTPVPVASGVSVVPAKPPVELQPKSIVMEVPQADPWVDASAPKKVAVAEPRDIDTTAILQRATVADEVQVKHVLLAWEDLAVVYEGSLGLAAQTRSNAAAAELANSIAVRLQLHPDEIDSIITELSEDSASTSEPIVVTSTTALLPAFKQLALRLQLNEVGIVRTDVGYHVVLRVSPPPADPVESNAILARPPVQGTVFVQHVLIGWRDVPAAKSGTLDERAKARSKSDADKLALNVKAKLRAGSKMTALMKQFSEDPGSKDSGKEYEVDAQTPFVEPFKKLALRLKVGEAGLVRSAFGWHIIKRNASPPADALESTAMLQRAPVTRVAKVKHILLSYDQTARANQDPRGERRTRAQLVALVKKTIAALNANAPIEPLMAELSEDPGSAQSGISYDVTPEAGLVAPFKALGLRLNVREVGVVKTDFGYHIIQRVE